MPCSAALVVMSCGTLAAAAAAQCTTPWLPGDGVPGVDGLVAAATAWDPDGVGPLPARLVVGGTFSLAGSTAVQNIAALDPATGTWTALGTGLAGTPVTGFQPVVQALLAHSGGELLAGGWFTTAGGVPASCIARWNGSAWSALGTGVGTASPYPSENVFGVRALAELPGGDVVAAGQFSSAGGVAAANVARWNGANWSALGSGIPGAGLGLAVHALATLPGGDLVAAGKFPFAGGHNLARWNGAAWSLFGGANVGSTLHALHVLPGGDLVVTGRQFSAIGATAVGAIARWNGATWSTLAGGFDQPFPWNGCGNALASTAAGDLVVAGEFALAGTTPVHNVARWDGTGWHAMGAGSDSRTPEGAWALRCLARLPAGELFLGGDCKLSGGNGMASLAQWNGTDWTAVGFGRNRPVTAMLQHSDGSLFVGGGFTTFGATTTNVGGLARWHGGAWTFLGGGVRGGNQGRVLALAELPGGDVLAAGDFDSAGGVAANNIARWNGTAWQPYGGPLGVSSGDFLDRILVLPSGAVVIGGAFTLPGGSGFGLAISTGGAWQNGQFLGGPAGASPLAIHPSGGFLAFGSGGTISGLLHWDNGWSQLASVTPTSGPGGPPGWIGSAHFLPDGELVVAGSFDSVQGVPAANVARLGSGGWQALPGLPVSVLYSVEDLVVLPDGDLVVGGKLPTLANLARWNGTTWQPFGTGLAGSRATASALLLTDEGDLLVGGSFTSGGGQVSAHLATIRTTCPAGVVVGGPACTGSGSAHSLAALAKPWIGGTFRSRAEGLPVIAAVFTLVGFAPLAVPLPLLFPEGQAGCDLLVTPDIVGIQVAVGGRCDFAIAVPDTVAIVGATFLHQLLPVEFDAGFHVLTVTATNSLHGTVGAF